MRTGPQLEILTQRADLYLMTYADPAVHHLPDPTTQPEFYAHVPTKRLLAWVVDTVIVLVMLLVIVLLTGLLAAFVLPMLIFIVSMIYRTVTIANRSATWGMRLFAIELRDHMGHRLDLSKAAWHSFCFLMSCIFMPVQLVSAVFMATTTNGQGLTDIGLGTVMVNKRA